LTLDPWKVVADLSLKKERIVDADNASEYLPYLMNLAFSYYTDTIFYANEMNLNHHLPNLLQYEFYFNSLRKKKRFTKWAKKDFAQQQAVADYFGYSQDKAKEALKLLKPEQLEVIMKQAENVKEINTS
jgi:hypothetical protein